MASDNKNQPEQFIGNKVTGILFENKADHTTYFGANIEYIQGIHMIPLLAPSAVARTREFVLEEWTTYFSDGRVNNIEGGWKGIIYGNYASVYPQEAWEFFNAQDFDPAWLDGGASLTWYLAYAAGELEPPFSRVTCVMQMLTRGQRWAVRDLRTTEIRGGWWAG